MTNRSSQEDTCLTQPPIGVHYYAQSNITQWSLRINNKHKSNIIKQTLAKVYIWPKIIVHGNKKL